MVHGGMKGKLNELPKKKTRRLAKRQSASPDFKLFMNLYFKNCYLPTHAMIIIIRINININIIILPFLFASFSFSVAVFSINLSI